MRDRARDSDGPADGEVNRGDGALDGEEPAAAEAPPITEAPDAPNSTPAMERADELLDAAGERMGRWAAEASLRMRRATALARETAEDMLAEAQAIRRRTPP